MEWFEGLNQDELSFTMEALTEKTKSGAISWDITAYLPISFTYEAEEEEESCGSLSQMFNAEAELNGCSIEIELSEHINIATGKGDLYATITTVGDENEHKRDVSLSFDSAHYEDYTADELLGAYKNTAIVRLTDALIPIVSSSDAAGFGFRYARFINETGIPKKLLGLPLTKLGEKLMNEKRLADFHRIVLDTSYRKKLIGEL